MMEDRIQVTREEAGDFVGEIFDRQMKAWNYRMSYGEESAWIEHFEENGIPREYLFGEANFWRLADNIGNFAINVDPYYFGIDKKDFNPKDYEDDYNNFKEQNGMILEWKEDWYGHEVPCGMYQTNGKVKL